MMRPAAFLLALLAALPVQAYGAERIGLAVPTSGRQAPVGDRVDFGALMALEDARADGATIELVVVDTACTEQGAVAAAEQLKAASVQIVIGPLCSESAVALVSAMGSVPVVALDTRFPLLERERKHDGRPLFELGHAPDAEARALVEQVLPLFNNRPYAVLDDGSVPMRALSDTVRLITEETGARPMQAVNFRPLQSTYRTLLRRLARSGIEAVIVLGAPEDVVTIARDLRSLGFNWSLATGESGRLLAFSDPPLPPGATVLSLQTADPTTQQLERLAQRLLAAKADVEDALVLGYAAMQVAVAFDAAMPLENQTLPTVLGPVSFGQQGRATPLSFRVVETTGPNEPRRSP